MLLLIDITDKLLTIRIAMSVHLALSNVVLNSSSVEISSSIFFFYCIIHVWNHTPICHVKVKPVTFVTRSVERTLRSRNLSGSDFLTRGLSRVLNVHIHLVQLNFFNPSKCRFYGMSWKRWIHIRSETCSNTATLFAISTTLARATADNITSLPQWVLIDSWTRTANITRRISTT